LAGLKRQNLVDEAVVPRLEILVDEQVRRSCGFRPRFRHATRARYARASRRVKRCERRELEPPFCQPERERCTAQLQCSLDSCIDLESIRRRSAPLRIDWMSPIVGA